MFSATTAFEEDYILPLSYKEFVYGKRSLLEKFPGLEAEKMAGVRSFFGFMMAFPGKKMSFMGSEFGQVSRGITTASWNGICLRMRGTVRCRPAFPGAQPYLCQELSPLAGRVQQGQLLLDRPGPYRPGCSGLLPDR